MRRFILPTVLLLLSACGGDAGDNKVTETQMDDLDSIEGTISDDMINTDQSTDEAPVDAPPPGQGAALKAKSDKPAEADPVAAPPPSLDEAGAE